MNLFIYLKIIETMKKNILNRPFPHLRFILKNLFSLKEVEQDLFFFQTGREAFIYGLNKIGIKKGSKILLPAFMCDSLSEYIISAGYKVRYVDINMHMSIDLNKIESFIIPKGIGVNYNPGIWHFPLISTEDMNFLVVDRLGDGENLILYDLNKENITLEFE